MENMTENTLQTAVVITQNDNDKKIRKYRSSLSICGISVIALGLWAVIKTVFNMVMNPLNIDSIPELKPFAGLLNVFMFSVSAVILTIELGLRVFVGLSAIFESRGKTRKPVYIALAVIIAGFIAYNVLPTIISMLRMRKFLFTTIASLLLDISSFAVLAELISSSIRLKIALRRDKKEKRKTKRLTTEQKAG